MHDSDLHASIVRPDRGRNDTQHRSPPALWTAVSTVRSGEALHAALCRSAAMIAMAAGGGAQGSIAAPAACRHSCHLTALSLAGCLTACCATDHFETLRSLCRPQSQGAGRTASRERCLNSASGCRPQGGLLFGSLRCPGSCRMQTECHSSASTFHKLESTRVVDSRATKHAVHLR